GRRPDHDPRTRAVAPDRPAAGRHRADSRPRRVGGPSPRGSSSRPARHRSPGRPDHPDGGDAGSHRGPRMALALAAAPSCLLADGMTPRRLRVTGIAVVYALVDCIAALGTAAYGAIPLARSLGSGLLVDVFLIIGAYGAVKVAEGLLAFSFRA